eukprot:scaffold110317_cov40-Phaeocystis_antarctica.AAC.1
MWGVGSASARRRRLRASSKHSRRMAAVEAARSSRRRMQFEVEGSVMLVMMYKGFGDAVGDGSERVIVDPNPGSGTGTGNSTSGRRRLGTGVVLTDGVGNTLPDTPHDAGSLYAPLSNAPAGNTVEAGPLDIALCGSNTTLALGRLLPPLVAVVHGLVRTAGPLLPYAVAAMQMRATAARRSAAGEVPQPSGGRRVTPRWGPCFWFVCTLTLIRP